MLENRTLPLKLIASKATRVAALFRRSGRICREPDATGIHLGVIGFLPERRRKRVRGACTLQQKPRKIHNLHSICILEQAVTPVFPCLVQGNFWDNTL